MPLLFFLIAWPLAELWLIIRVGQEAGAFNTVMLVVATAVLGLLLVQLEWRRLHLSLQARVREGKEALGPLLETAAVGLAGLFLLVPGFISDGLGLLLLLPVTRKILIHPLKKNAAATTFDYRDTSFQETDFKEGSLDASRADKVQRREGQVLEGEYQRKDESPLEK